MNKVFNHIRKAGKHMLFIIIILAINSFTVLIGQEKADIAPEIEKCIRAGNATELAKYFKSSVELVLLETENVYSKNQAEAILKDFFAKNPPKSYQVIHKGGEAQKFFIGLYKTDSVTYRVYYFLKAESGKYMINLFRIENDEKGNSN